MNRMRDSFLLLILPHILIGIFIICKGYIILGIFYILGFLSIWLFCTHYIKIWR